MLYFIKLVLGGLFSVAVGGLQMLEYRAPTAKSFSMKKSEIQNYVISKDQ